MLITVVGSNSLPVSLEAAKQHCRAPDDDDVLVDRSLRAAIGYVETATNLALSPRTLQYRLDGWPCWNRVDYGLIDLPVAPVRDVTDVEYLDENGNLQTIVSPDWNWSRSHKGAYVWFDESYAFPTVKTNALGTVRITFDAGFDDPDLTGSGDDPDLQVPFGAIAAVLMLTSHWYENREAVSKDQMHPVPTAVDALLSQIRIYR